MVIMIIIILYSTSGFKVLLYRHTYILHYIASFLCLAILYINIVANHYELYDNSTKITMYSNIFVHSFFWSGLGAELA